MRSKSASREMNVSKRDRMPPVGITHYVFICNQVVGNFPREQPRNQFDEIILKQTEIPFKPIKMQI